MSRALPAAAGDDGRPDARLAAALAADDGSPAARGEVLAALATARVFLALSAAPVGPPVRSGGERSTELSLLSLVSPAGERALPAFLDGHEVQRWRPQARPVPVAGPLACRTARDDGAGALLLDPRGRAVPVGGAALAELAAGRVPVPGAALSTRRGQVELAVPTSAPPGLESALGRSLAGEPVHAARLLQGPDGPVLGVVADLPPAALAALAARLVARLGPDLPATGLDLAAVGPDGPGLPVPVRRRGLLRRRWSPRR